MWLLGDQRGEDEALRFCGVGQDSPATDVVTKVLANLGSRVIEGRGCSDDIMSKVAARVVLSMMVAEP